MSKFNQTINEMLVVLNATKKEKPKKKDFNVDPVSDLMNGALSNFGISVENPKDDDEDTDDNEDEIEGSVEKLGDLDLPRPEDDEDEPSEDDFNFLNVGNPTDVEPRHLDANGCDCSDCNGGECCEDNIKFEYNKGEGLVVSIGDKSVTLTPEHVQTVKDFIDSLNFEDSEDGEDNGEGSVKDDNGDNGDNGGKDDGESGIGESIDDPNPSTKRCPKCGRTMSYDSHSMTYRCGNCNHFERGASRLSDTTRMHRW